MTDIEDTTCTASYGATTNFVSSVSGRGAGLVGWVQQLSRDMARGGGAGS